jgi:hypothetical protein
MKKPDVYYVLAEAVEAYKAAAFRDRHGYTKRGYTAEQAAKEFPKYFSLHSSGKIKFIGKSADKILEEYLQEMGYPPNSEYWFRLARQVTELAQEEEEGDGGKITKTYFDKPKRQNKIRHDRRTRKVHTRKKWSRKPKKIID